MGLGDEGGKECTPVHPGPRSSRISEPLKESNHQQGLVAAMRIRGCAWPLCKLLKLLRDLYSTKIWLLKIRGAWISTNLSSEELSQLRFLLDRDTAWFRPRGGRAESHKAGSRV